MCDVPSTGNIGRSRGAGYRMRAIIFGAVLDAAMKDDIKITVIATGFDRRSETSSAAASGVARPPAPSPDLEIPAFLRRAQK